ncbi:MAG TPA: uracil-DNA glycosylase [Candidatus Levybacteria bacterium]|nr:uracil-DNA glycosylase [Candidatus Levybacteria bacterium]
MPNLSKTDQMRTIRDAVLNFTQSPLYTYRTENHYFPVIGEGNHEADIVFIGEAPGKNEAEQARPFCGASGRVLEEMLDSISLNRKDVYVTNIVKDRPPDNRDPSPEEIRLYSPFLDAQLQIIQPSVIATLGRFSMKYILDKYDLPDASQTITALHGKAVQATAPYGNVHIVPLYHPAVALYSGSSKKTLLEDMQTLVPFITK